VRIKLAVFIVCLSFFMHETEQKLILMKFSTGEIYQNLFSPFQFSGILQSGLQAHSIGVKLAFSHTIQCNLYRTGIWDLTCPLDLLANGLAALCRAAWLT
jgi:hypothetical protein